jgi:hypothetical protein
MNQINVSIGVCDASITRTNNNRLHIEIRSRYETRLHDHLDVGKFVQVLKSYGVPMQRIGSFMDKLNMPA